MKDGTRDTGAEERFRLVVEGAPIGMMMVDQAGLIVLVNAQVEKIFGYGRSELLGQRMELLVPERFRSRHPGLRETFFAAPSQREMGAGRELYGLCKDGSEFPLEIGLSPIETAEGTGVMASIIDITERKRAEEVSAVLSAIVTSSPDAIVSKTLEGIVTSWNASAERLFGYSAEEMIGRPILRLIPPERHNEEAHILARLRAGEGIEHYETVRTRKDGSFLEVSLTISPVRDRAGRIIGASKIIRDISESNRSQVALRESEARFRIMADTAPVLVWMADTTKLCTWFNKPWIDFTGRSMEQEAGNGWVEGVHPDDFERCLDLYSTAFDARRPFTMEYRLRRYDGEYRWFLDTGIPRVSETGDFIGYIGSCIDITDRKQAEKDVRALNEELERRVLERTAELEAVNKELESFSYSVSHDLRAPLRSMEGFGQALLEDYAGLLDDQGKDYLNRITAASVRMGRLIDDLLNLSRLSRGEMHRVPVDLSALAQDIAKDLQKTDFLRHVEVVIKEGLVLHGDAQLIRAMMENLIGNAWKYTSKHARARIEVGSTAYPDGRLVYFVKDDGAGFDMAYVGKLFGAFQRLHLSGEFPGTGIGLATVKRIVHRHGGTVWAEGEIEKGATFYFTL